LADREEDVHVVGRVVTRSCGELLRASQRAIDRGRVFVDAHACGVHERRFVQPLLSQEPLCSSSRVDERREQVNRGHPVASSLAQRFGSFDDLGKLGIATLEHRDFSFMDAPTWPKNQPSGATEGARAWRKKGNSSAGASCAPARSSLLTRGSQ
jgi:hypothetical protein